MKYTRTNLSQQKTKVTMDELEVDYDKNVTDLYSSISDSNWDQAIVEVKERPEEARTWVVRYHPNSDSIMWRFLPLHSACAKQPPENVLNALVHAYRKGAQCRDDQGMLPLHYASGNQASLEVIRLLLLANPEGASIADPHGMLPLHYLAQWGPSTIQVLEVMLFANRDAPFAKDNEGSTPLDLARYGEYPERDEVVEILKEFQMEAKNQSNRNNNQPSPRSRKAVTNDENRGGVGDANANAHKDPIQRLQEATAAQEKKREEYMGMNEGHGEQRDDESVLGALPRIALSNAVTYTSSFQDESSLSKNSRRTGANGGISGSGSSSGDIDQPIDAQTDAKKMVADLKAEVERLRSEAALAEAEAEKTISEERAKMQNALDEMKANLAKCVGETKESRSVLSEKEDYGKLVESRLEDKENELKSAMKKNETLRKDLDTIKKNIAAYKTKTHKLDDHLTTLSKTMEGMMKEQQQIMQASIRHEQHMKKVSMVRQQKMQELIDQEVQFAKLTLEKQKQNELGSEEMVNEAMEKQKHLMAAVASVLAESRQH